MVKIAKNDQNGLKWSKMVKMPIYCILGNFGNFLQVLQVFLVIITDTTIIIGITKMTKVIMIMPMARFKGQLKEQLELFLRWTKLSLR